MAEFRNAKWLDAGNTVVEFEKMTPRGWETSSAMKDSGGHKALVAAGIAVVAYEKPAVSRSDVNAEKFRRTQMTIGVSLTSGKNFNVDMNEQGRDNIHGLATAGIDLKANNDTSTTVNFTDADDNDIVLDSTDMVEMGRQVRARISFIHDKARALKKMNPIPVDFDADKHWR